ncbi:hypothetical protein BT93_K0646 [Corymbia citriodora subsp. variegata]|nr:hypothetical protein BT93_K0646 [Corymbia citriodora subsp. variegata]KAF8006404.1 hypothetical protein BT93_K0646 [Corymbia citriodora subsp. variegata]KAF8006405.1 hypothetical protein BT93_K0646 [Corymbia citriodora subsp. variegata]
MNWVLQSKLYKLPQLALAHCLQATRLFIDARVKWVRDPFLDTTVEKEKDLKPLCSLLRHILTSPSLSLPLSSASLLHLPSSATTSTAASFFLKYPSVFTIFQPSPGLPLHVRLTPSALSIYRQESALHLSPPLRHSAATRLAKLLMLAGSSALPFHIIDKFWWDLGLPPNYVPDLLSDYPDYFNVRAVKDETTGKELLALELISWRDELAVSAMQERVKDGDFNGKPGTRIRFSMNFPRGFDLEKRVKAWVDQWQDLPYISPYENAFHLAPSGDQAEKWMVAVIHELLWLLPSKKTERDNLLCWGEHMGFGTRFKKVLAHHPGIFYISNKLKTQTVVLREAHKKDFLVERHPLMGMRHRYIYLMSKAKKSQKQINSASRMINKRTISSQKFAG